MLIYLPESGEAIEGVAGHIVEIADFVKRSPPHSQTICFGNCERL